jgi:hypothetical protein
VLSGVGEILVPGDLRIGIGLQEVKLAFVREPVVEARVAAQTEQTIDALGGGFNLTAKCLIQLRGT